MASHFPRVALARSKTAAALARALRTTAAGLLEDDERPWVDRIEARRQELMEDETVAAPGFDAGTAQSPGWIADLHRPLPVSGISILFSVPPGWGLFQLRLVRELAPRSCLELGTGLGLSAAYQAAALELSGGGRLTTLEGARTWGEIAQTGIQRLGLERRAQVRLGPIDDTLPAVLDEIAPIDYAFLDADHTEEATLAHFDAVLPRLAPGAVAVLDDIGFSRPMWRAWKVIRRRPRVARSFSLGRMGVVSVE
jgi:predicted O-methyltransferase YrrM